MSTQFFNLSNENGNCFAIIQCQTLNEITFYLRDKDVSTYTPSGEIRDDYLDNQGNLLATFSFEPIVFGSVTINGETFDASVIKPTLTAVETRAIPATFPRYNSSTKLVQGINAYVYDLKLEGATETIIPTRGLVEVLPVVTQ